MPGGFATTWVTVVNVPPGKVVTMTVVNWDGAVRTVEPPASVVVNVTAVDHVLVGSGTASLPIEVGRSCVGAGSPGDESEGDEGSD